MTIGEVARQAEVETSTIRYYERIGLLPRPQRVNGRRVYDAEVLKQLALIKASKSVGFTINEILTLLALWKSDGKIADAGQVFVERKLTEVQTIIAQASQIEATLTSLLACGCWQKFEVPLEAFVANAALNSHKF